MSTQQQATLVDAVSDGAGHILLVSERGELIRLNTETLETDLIAVPYSGQVYSSAKPEKPGALVVAQFSGPRKIDISQFQ